ncbi:hypothetical protein C1D09_003445 [Mesorhizobium intechi]|uniref:hypothetical protein n=1 Tax=Mesorhizobium intechi TaxID=537601 RepID=UPI000CAEF688|nr:hypothetical protein [Mesorhizobium intechi]TSE13542.1 hypothetical protein C1D09_003445 [Mesorhizobium intechi]
MNTQEASELIMREVNQAPGSIGSAGAGGDFCSIWPKAKPILELLSGIAILIPGVGATAGAVLKGLIVVGDKIAEEICH